MDEAEKAERGRSIKVRQLDLGLTNGELAAQAGVDRESVKRAHDGDAQERTYHKLEAVLDRLDVEHSPEVDLAPREEVIEMTLMIAALGIEATVRGPVAHPEVIREQLLNLVHGVVQETQATPGIPQTRPPGSS